MRGSVRVETRKAYCGGTWTGHVGGAREGQMGLTWEVRSRTSGGWHLVSGMWCVAGGGRHGGGWHVVRGMVVGGGWH
eukprot:6591296-Prymnesium_polylepis.1